MRRHNGDVAAPGRPLVHVLNGDYPEALLKRMSAPGLGRLVAKLVQCTTKSSARPPWWPRGLRFSRTLEPGEIRAVIVSCCRFFKQRAAPKHRFLRYLRLDAGRAPAAPPAPPPPATGAKFAACAHIPFSSDVGRLMAARDRHGLSEDLKLRRLERSEWYTNRPGPRAGAEFEAAAPRPPPHSHVYKMPKRQQHQRRPAFRSVEFLARFCTPVSVAVERLDVAKMDKRRELVVVIRDTEKMCCDLRRDGKVRTSPRLRDV